MNKWWKNARLLAALLAVLLVPAISYSQNNCYYYDATTKTWKYNTTCSQATTPWVITSNKTFTVENTITLSGQDNAELNIGTGGSLGSAAFLPASSFQPSGSSIGLSTTSSDSLTIGTGAKTFNVAAGLGYATNMVLTAYYTSNLSAFMQGTVTTYNTLTGELVMNIISTGGSGTYTAWTISVSGPQGVAGPAGASGAPIGTMLMWAGSSLPTGYLFADGSCVSQSTYSDLYAAIGSTWNTSSNCTGVSDFGLPNMLGRTPMGAGQGLTAEGGGTGTNRVLGTLAGEETHTLTAAEMPVHNHGGGATVTSSGQSATHTHTYSAVTSGTGYVLTTNGEYGNLAYYASRTTGNASADHTHTTAVTIPNAGSGSAHTLINPVAVVNYIIKYQ